LPYVYSWNEMPAVGYAVVPANAGTHNHRLLLLRKVIDQHFSKRPLRRMGPCVRRDDEHTLAAAGIAYS